MQCILDEMQADYENELEKVSLERLADKNPDLLSKIYNIAKDNLLSSGGNDDGTQSPGTSTSSLKDPRRTVRHSANAGDGAENEHGNNLPSFIIEARSPALLARSKLWNEYDLLKGTAKKSISGQTGDDGSLNAADMTEFCDTVVAKLRQRIKEVGTAHTASNAFKLQTSVDAANTVMCYAVTSTTADLVGSVLEGIKKQRKQQEQRANGNVVVGATMSSPVSTISMIVDKKLFSTDGIKEKNDDAIGSLYEIGLPFLSSADGMRFRTQLELSRHLDDLFRKNRLEKSMIRTEERGWYAFDDVWTREATGVSKNLGIVVEATANTVVDDNQHLYDPLTSSVPADETRERCSICGLKFRMRVDEEDGSYQYDNCREISLVHDEAAEQESDDVLVHVTCWRGLGSPAFLLPDQAYVVKEDDTEG